MKKSVSFALWLPLAIATGANANQDTPKVPSTKVPYQQQVPLAVRNKMPHGSQSRFFGIAKFEQTVLALHLYEQTQKIEPTADAIPLPKRVLNVFVKRKVGNHQEFSLINSVSLNSIHYDSADFDHAQGFGTIGMNWLWLDSKQHKIPVIMINALSANQLYYQGTNILVVFPQGLKYKSVVQGFGYGTNSNSEYWQSFFNDTDERGFLMAKTVFGANPDLDDEVVWLQWNGEGFARTK